MENASKALMMAAGILIGVAILSLAVYLFVSFGSASAEIHEQNDANRINEFNTQFTSYVGKEDITIYDVITVANLATEWKKSNWERLIYISIFKTEYRWEKRYSKRKRYNKFNKSKGI